MDVSDFIEEENLSVHNPGNLPVTTRTDKPIPSNVAQLIAQAQARITRTLSNYPRTGLITEQVGRSIKVKVVDEVSGKVVAEVDNNYDEIFSENRRG